MLSIEHLSKRYDTLYATKDFSLTVNEGEFVTLLGPSGSGKTTVLRMIAGLEHPTTGSVRIDGTDITYLSPQKRNIGVVFQSYALFPNMNAFDNIAFPLRVRKWDSQRVLQRVHELLDLVGLQQRSHHLPQQLSGGERQRVALARALAFHPPLLLLDEPLSALDAKVRQSLREFLKDIQKATQVTTVMVTHDQEEALELSDRVVIMAHGQIEQVGTPLDVYYAPRTEFAEYFIGQMIDIPVKVMEVNSVEGDNSIALLRWGTHVFFWVMSVQNAIIGHDLRLRVRPESITVVSVKDKSAIKGKILAKAFSGPMTRIRLLVHSEEIVVDVLSTTAARMEVGQEIGVKIEDPRVPASIRSYVGAEFS